MKTHCLITLLVSLIAMPPGMAFLQSPVVPKAEVNRRQLEELEDKSEDVANGLLELSVSLRNGETKKVAAYFSDPAQFTMLPATTGALTPQVKWIKKQDWIFTPGQTAVTTRAANAKHWDALLANFAEIEDVRFK